MYFANVHEKASFTEESTITKRTIQPVNSLVSVIPVLAQWFLKGVAIVAGNEALPRSKADLATAVVKVYPDSNRSQR